MDSMPLDGTLSSPLLVFVALDCCTNATNFCIICPTSKAIFDTFQLGVLAPRLESLTLDQRAIGPPKLGYSERPPSKGWYSQESVTASLQFPKVTVLCLSNMKYRLGTAALSHPTIRTWAWIIAKIQLNHPSVRLAMHEAELAKHGLPLTEPDEERLFGEAWSPQNSWDMTGFAAYSYTI
ncbi:hypothetical protein EXIGLDRAFT_755191 [Exidia glandulosa HHB12029]|uniref:Uncharacterized protein n=1 Tax=Exidia glandulosa HHB12029 TaxID=1314781 RepID=A0A165C9K4_EXIGL|nr:hypothetical protein EXIGLDRAFT_755191 [Exidia glandulosa HHB12029]